MVVQIQTTFTNGLTLRPTNDPYFLSDWGIDGYISLIDESDISIDLVEDFSRRFLAKLSYKDPSCSQ